MWQAMSEKTVLALGVLRDAAGRCIQRDSVRAAAVSDCPLRVCVCVCDYACAWIFYMTR